MTDFNFDAVLLIGFGGPTGPDEIRPFLEHVLRGRPVAPGRIDAVAHHYELIGGRSPFNALTEQQRAALEARLAEVGNPVPVAMGMWHVRPFVHDVLRELAERGMRRIAGVVMAAFYDRVTLQRYVAIVDEALRALAIADLEVQYISSPERQVGFIAANVEHIRTARARLPEPLRRKARLLFTAHSVPTAVGENSGYVASFEAAAQRIAGELEIADYRCVYQSRSGAPSDPWLAPDVCDAVREEVVDGAQALVLAPIGFVCDHVEVLYDLDIEAAQLAQTLGVPLVRAATVGTHPKYIDALANSLRHLHDAARVER
jgi:ferrochelatase